MFAPTSCGALSCGCRTARPAATVAPAIVPRLVVGRERVDSPAPPILRAAGPLRGRPSHGRPERLLAGRGRRDRQGNPALPRAGKRLERHRLQLPRRPLRDGLRGAVRRRGAQCRRRARAAASTPARQASPCSGRTAARPPPRRLRRRSPSCSPGASTSRTPTRRAVLTFVSGGSERFPSGVPVLLRARLRPSRHRLHGVPRRRALRAAERPRRPPRGRSACRRSSSRVSTPDEGLVRFRARLSSSQPWTVVDHGAGQREVARGTGTGHERRLDLGLDAGHARERTAGRSRAGSARPATGPLRIGGKHGAARGRRSRQTPTAITPNGDGQADSAVVSVPADARPRT